MRQIAMFCNRTSWCTTHMIYGTFHLCFMRQIATFCNKTSWCKTHMIYGTFFLFSLSMSDRG